MTSFRNCVGWQCVRPLLQMIQVHMDNWRMFHKKRFNNLFPKKKKKHLQKLEYVIIIYIYIKNISSYLFKNQFLDVLVKF